MWNIGFLDTPDAHFGSFFSDFLDKFSFPRSCEHEDAANTRPALSLIDLSIPQPHDLTANIILAAPGARDMIPLIPCKMLILSEDFPRTAIRQSSVPIVIDYGLSARNTLTLSSILPDGLVIALQRDIATLPGHRCEQQEFMVSCHPDLGVSGTMAVTALLLALGVAPAELAQKEKQSASR